MIDSFEKLTDICIKNGLGAETVDYLVDIKKALEEKEKIEQALDIACFELEEKDYKLFDLFNAYVYVYYDIKDRHEWKEYLLESVEDDEWRY